jgi:hypothetical protein
MINASDSITPSEHGMARQALDGVENPPPMYTPFREPLSQPQGGASGSFLSMHRV